MVNKIFCSCYRYIFDGHMIFFILYLKVVEINFDGGEALPLQLNGMHDSNCLSQ